MVCVQHLIIGISILVGFILLRILFCSLSDEDSSGFRFSLSKNEDNSQQPPNKVLQEQLKLLSKCSKKNCFFRESKCSSCLGINNDCGVPNIGSYYLGSAASLTKDTNVYIPKGSSCRSNCFLNGQVDSVLQPENLIVGKAFRFAGDRGGILIEMRSPALISGVTMIHPHLKELPKGHATSCPKDILLHGFPDSDSSNSVELGRYRYKAGGAPTQTFVLNNKSALLRPYKSLLFNITSNYGNRLYTSVYKIQVHGISISDE